MARAGRGKIQDRLKRYQKDNSSVAEWLPAFISSIATMNPTPLIAKGAGKASGSEGVGLLAGAISGGATGLAGGVPSVDVAKGIVKSAGKYGLSKVDEDLGRVAEIADATSSNLSGKGYSMLKTALPILGLLGAGAYAKSKGGRFSTGLMIGNQLLSGHNAIKTMKMNEETHKQDMIKTRYDIDQLDAKAARDANMIKPKNQPWIYKVPKEMRDRLLKAFEPSLNKDGEMAQGEHDVILKQLNSSSELYKTGADLRMAELDANVETAYENLSKAQLDGKPDAIKKAMDTFNHANDIRNLADKKLTKGQRERKSLEEAKIARDSAVTKERQFKEEGLGVYAKDEAALKSPVGKLIDDRQKLINAGAALDSPDVKNIEAAIQKSITPSGMSLEIDSEGNISFSAGPSDMTKGTKTKLEKDIISGDLAISELDEIERLYNKDFLTYRGRAKAWGQKTGEKLELGTETDFSNKQSQWFQQAKQAFFVYRKWVTGVAGGEKEMSEIKKAFPDPESDGPSQFGAKLEQQRYWKSKVVNWLKHTKQNGISITDTPNKVTTRDGIKFGYFEDTDKWVQM